MLMRNAVHQGRATVQGRPQVDSSEARRGDRCQPIPQGLPQDERGFDCVEQWKRPGERVTKLLMFNAGFMIDTLSCNDLMRLNTHNCEEISRSIQVLFR